MSGKRDSNPRPSPWQGDAPPIELFPHCAEGQTRTDIPGFSDQCRDHLGYFGQCPYYTKYYPFFTTLVPGMGLEPIRLATHRSERCLYTNFNTLAKLHYSTI